MSAAIPGLIKALFLMDILVVLAYLFDIGLGQPHHSLTRFVNLNDEGNLPSWHSAYQLSLLGIFLAINAYLYRRGRNSMPWPLILGALAFTFLSLDEISQIHERIGTISDALLPEGTREGGLFEQTGIWMFILGPPAIFLAGWWIKNMRSYLHRSKRILALLFAGLCIFLGGALIPELLFNWGQDSLWLRSLLITVEEGCEMAGVTILVWASYLNMHDEFNYTLSNH